MQIEKIHFETSNGTSCVGSMVEDQVLKASKLIAVKVSTP